MNGTFHETIRGGDTRVGTIYIGVEIIKNRIFKHREKLDIEKIDINVGDSSNPITIPVLIILKEADALKYGLESIIKQIKLA